MIVDKYIEETSQHSLHRFNRDATHVIYYSDLIGAVRKARRTCDGEHRTAVAVTVNSGSVKMTAYGWLSPNRRLRITSIIRGRKRMGPREVTYNITRYVKINHGPAAPS